MIYAERVADLATEIPDRAMFPIGTRRARDIVDQHLAQLSPQSIPAVATAGHSPSLWGIDPDELAARQSAPRPRTRVEAGG